MPKADKRERQRQNRDVRRAEMLAAEKRYKQRRTARNLAFLLLPVVLLFVALQVFSGDDSSGITRSYATAPGKVVADRTDYTATIDTSMGKIEVALDVNNSLGVANNFVFLARHKFYDGLRFVRVARDFVIQAGSPTNTSSGGPGYTNIQTPPTTIAGTPAYPLGTVAMAKTPKQAPGSFGSQFFIVTGTAASDLSNQFATLGQVTGGLDVAQKIGLLYPKDGDGTPTKKVTIRKVTISSTPAASTTTAAP